MTPTCIRRRRVPYHVEVMRKMRRDHHGTACVVAQMPSRSFRAFVRRARHLTLAPYIVRCPA